MDVPEANRHERRTMRMLLTLLASALLAGCVVVPATVPPALSLRALLLLLSPGILLLSQSILLLLLSGSILRLSLFPSLREARAFPSSAFPSYLCALSSRSGAPFRSSGISFACSGTFFIDSGSLFPGSSRGRPYRAKRVEGGGSAGFACGGRALKFH